jgi:hypothetical protein
VLHQAAHDWQQQQQLSELSCNCSRLTDDSALCKQQLCSISGGCRASSASAAPTSPGPVTSNHHRAPIKQHHCQHPPINPAPTSQHPPLSAPTNQPSTHQPAPTSCKRIVHPLLHTEADGPDAEAGCPVQETGLSTAHKEVSGCHGWLLQCWLDGCRAKSVLPGCCGLPLGCRS